MKVLGLPIVRNLWFMTDDQPQKRGADCMKSIVVVGRSADG